MPSTSFFPDLSRPLRFPHDLLRIVVWAYFRPFTLERYLQQFDPELKLDSSLITLWRKGREHPPLRHLVVLTLFHALLTPWLAFPLAYALQALGVAVDYRLMLEGVLEGVLVGVLLGVLGYVLLGVLLGVLGDGLGGVLLGVLWDVLGGVLWGVLWGVLLGVLVSVLGYVLGYVLEGVLKGVGLALGVVVGWLRLHECLLESPLAWLLGRVDADGRHLRLSPPFWHEVIRLPLPGVERQVLALARRDRQAGLAAVEYLAAYRYGWARKVAARVALRFLLESMARARTLQDLAALYRDLAPWWRLPEVREQWGDLVTFVETVTGKVQAALESDTAYNKALRLQEALQTVEAWQQALPLAASPLTGDLRPVLATWQALLQQAVAQARGEEFIPNPYIAGAPLATASATFKGRRAVMRRLEAEFAAFRTQRPALLLFGGRRMGKTSLIRQLPARLGPEVVPVVLDAQGLGTVASPQAFWQRLIHTARRQAEEHRGLRLPAPDPAQLAQDPFAAMQAWMDAVEARAPDAVFLLALDEYEALQQAMDAGRLDVRVLDLLRHMLQHRRQWLVLFSGLYTFEDLPVVWSDRFINVRYFLLGPLEEEAARDLILRPVPEFEGKVHYPDEAVEKLLAETGRQPNWLQAALKALIRRLNEERRRQVTLDDVDWALAQVYREIPGDFRFFCEYAQPFPRRAEDPQVLAGYQAIVRLLALEPGITREELEARVPPEARRLVRPTLDFFLRREMLVQTDGGYRWAFPLLARWLRER